MIHHDEIRGIAMNLEQTIETMIRASEEMVARGEQVSTAFVAESADGQGFVFMAPWGDGEERKHVLNAVRSAFQEKGVVRYVVISEAWLAQYRNEAAFRKSGMPSQRPDRKEVIVAAAVETLPEKRAVFRVYSIDREAGKLVMDKDLSTCTELSGDLMGMLDGSVDGIDATVVVAELELGREKRKSEKKSVH